MSLRSQKLDSVDAKAARVLMAHGRAPNLLRAMDDSERSALAALVDDKGNLVDGAGAKFQAVLIAYNERHKATDESFEGEPVSVQPVTAPAVEPEPNEPPETDEPDE